MDTSNRKDIIKLFQVKKMVKVCAPMVRYSKLQFRTLVRQYNCDLCFSPMIMAAPFLQSSDKRDKEFSTDEGDSPLVVQFGANKVSDFVGAAEIVAPYCDGVDLNCGCPQKWAIQGGFGSALLTKPDLIKDLVLQLRNKIPKPFTVSAKIRILEDLRKTVELCQQLESAGVSFITVHARTPKQRTEPINKAALTEIRKSVKLPLIANGDVKTLADAERLHKETGYEGVMSARGILENPALYSGVDKTPVSCIENWLTIALESGIEYECLHKHLIFMLEKVLPKCERVKLNHIGSCIDIVDYLTDYFNIKIPKNIVVF